MGRKKAKAEKPVGMLGDLGAEVAWPRQEHADLLSPSADHARLQTKDIPELIQALDLQQEILNTALCRLLNASAVEAIEATRAFQLVSALRVELEALAAGTKSVALQPNIHGQALNYRGAHSDLILMKNEAAAAVEIMVGAGNVGSRAAARERVASTLAAAGMNFGEKQIREWEAKLKRREMYSAAVEEMASRVFLGPPGPSMLLLTGEGELMDPVQAVKAAWKPAEVIKKVRARLGILALVAVRLREPAKN
jgi:hypothetical protein